MAEIVLADVLRANGYSDEDVAALSPAAAAAPVYLDDPGTPLTLTEDGWR